MYQRAPDDFDQVRSALAPAWSYYALRLSSPSADRFLSRFAWLDDIDSVVEEPLDPFGTRERWRRDRLPVVPESRLRRGVREGRGADDAHVAGGAPR